MGASAYGVWYGLDELMGRSLGAQLVEVLLAVAVGIGVYAAAVWALRVPEARQIRELLVSRRGGRG
jgi:putative peptidoglycan lipid II flippase